MDRLFPHFPFVFTGNKNLNRSCYKLWSSYKRLSSYNLSPIILKCIFFPLLWPFTKAVDWYRELNSTRWGSTCDLQDTCPEATLSPTELRARSLHISWKSKKIQIKKSMRVSTFTSFKKILKGWVKVWIHSSKSLTNKDRKI